MHQFNLLILLDEIKEELQRVFNNVDYGLYWAGKVVYTFETPKDGVSHTFEVDIAAIDNSLQLVSRENVKKNIIAEAISSIY